MEKCKITPENITKDIPVKHKISVPTPFPTPVPSPTCVGMFD